MTKIDDKRVPALRFKGFNDDWAQQELKDLVSFYSGLTYHPEDIKSTGVFVIRSSNIKHGQLVNADNVYVDPKSVNSTYVRKKDIIVVVRNGSRNLIGKHAQVHNDISKSVIGAFMTGIRSNNNDFISALFDSDKFRKEIHKNLGATINQITTGEFKKMIFPTPQTLNEKEKIGNLISQINSLVSLQQRKLKQYQLIKKWLCSVVFNDTVHDDTNILFSNRVKANQLFESISKKGFKDLPVLSASQEKGMVFRDDISKNITYTNNNLNNYKLVFPGNFVVHLRSFQGGFSYSDKIGIASPAYTIFGFKDNIKYDPIFWKEKFKSYNFIQLLKKVTYGVRDGRSISFSDFLSLYLTFPDIEIQKKIGKCFKALDNQTSDQQCIIQQLKQLKQFLLQNMFI